MRQFVDHGYSRKNDLMDGQRAVFERGMLAQHLLLFRELARSKRYMNMPRSLALAIYERRPLWEGACSRWRWFSQ
ncbi:hypothetical protein F0170_15250 [Pseudomonas sp. MAFF 730085]|uniref:Uncharacterized protein n=1 Tax=Pseudomonas kitaguniensis TaxID=2607908 RepID=A0A5N7JVL1_9PSED|nr:hypothetical protein [Pseudomonas kitaguniensis]